jgi:hypothetical protein
VLLSTKLAALLCTPCLSDQFFDCDPRQGPDMISNPPVTPVSPPKKKKKGQFGACQNRKQVYPQWEFCNEIPKE